MNCRTTTVANQEDGAPHQGECEAEGGDENDGEKRTEGPARTRSYRIKREGPGIPKMASSEQLMTVVEQLRRNSEQLEHNSE